MGLLVRKIKTLIDMADSLGQYDLLDGFEVGTSIPPTIKQDGNTVKRLGSDSGEIVAQETMDYNYDGYGRYIVVDANGDGYGQMGYAEEDGEPLYVGELRIVVEYKKLPKEDEEDEEEAQKVKRIVSTTFNTIEGETVIFKKTVIEDPDNPGTMKLDRDVNFPFQATDIIEV